MASPGFKEMRFPLEVSAWMVGGPMWNTRVFSVQNGDESRLALWDYPLHKYNCGNALREAANVVATKRFQIRSRGRAYAFRVLDPFDYQCNAADGVLVATAVTGFWQLCKRYVEDGDVFLRKILKPIPGTVVVTKNGIAVADPVDYTTGLAGFASAPGDVLAWYGLFDVPVRFDVDWLEIGQDTSGLINWNSANLMEIRRPGASLGTPPPLLLAAQMGLDATAGPVPTTPPGPAPAPAPAATAVVITTAPPSGTVGVPSDPFHFRLDGPASSPVHVTPHGFANSTADGTWNPATLTLTSQFDDATSVYTPAVAGAHIVNVTNDGGLSNGNNQSYNVAAALALTLTPGNVSGAVGSPSPQFTVGSTSTLPAATAVTPHSSGSGGSFAPASVVIGGTNPATATFTRTAAAAGNESITLTNDKGLANPTAATYTAAVAPSAIALTPSTMTTQAGVASGNFTAALDRPATSQVIVGLASSGSGGTFASGSGAYATTVSSLTYAIGEQSKTFTRTPAANASAGTESISLTNSGGLTNPSPATLTVTAAAGGGGGSETAFTPDGNAVLVPGQAGVGVGYYFDVPPGKSEVDVGGFATDANRDFDFYVRAGAVPTTTTYDQKGHVVSQGQGAFVTFAPPAAGRYHMLVVPSATGSIYIAAQIS